MRRALAAALLVLALAGPALAQAPAPAPVAPPAASPMAEMQRYTEEVLRLIHDATLREKDTIAALQAALRRVALQIFGAVEASREVLGPHWEARTPAERDEFAQLFVDLLEATYIARIEGRSSFKVRYVGEIIEGDRADVRALVFNRKGQEVTVDARLARRDGRWLVYDVLVDKISLVGNYRAQFDRLIRKSGYAEMLRLVRAKRDQLLAAKRPAPE
ncbi:MAG: ABC transporter substrate-binding protein [Candidatus Rokubacteria bacterium]|nr:ABC transporter substrate-binding protein [Candidatus Rokubacteria bacterium]